MIDGVGIAAGTTSLCTGVSAAVVWGELIFVVDMDVRATTGW